MNDAGRRLIFDAAKRRGAVFKTRADVADLDAAINAAIGLSVPSPEPHTGLHVGPKGLALIHSFEQCRLEAYPDPGSRDGTPWTIGWGSTGPDIKRGTVWTQEQADERFAKDIDDFAHGVAKMVEGVSTNQNQFDAMVCLAYNIGLKGLRGSTVLRKHKAGDYPAAARAFLMWNKNDGKVMRGLTRRRLAEADLYDDPVEGTLQ